MNTIYQQLKPANQIQKVFLFLAIASTIIILFLHNPVNGYKTVAPEVLPVRVCPPEVDQQNPWKCTTVVEYQAALPLSILDWQSDQPVIAWLATLGHLLRALISIWILCGVGLFMFRNEVLPPKINSK